jgi:hypothetical protein
MAKKQLTVSMIYGGSFHRVDSVLDDEEIPPNLRKAKYLREPNPLDEEGDGYEEEIPTDEVFEEPPPLPRRSLRRAG